MKNQMIFDIYTENVNREGICGMILSFGIGSFTLIPTYGFDKSEPEQSLIIRIVGNANLLDNVKKIAWNIKHTNHQATILLSSYNCATEIL